jgi:hypothetical protein
METGKLGWGLFNVNPVLAVGKRLDPGSSAVFVWVGLVIFKTDPAGFCLVSGSNALDSA